MQQFSFDTKHIPTGNVLFFIRLFGKILIR